MYIKETRRFNQLQAVCRTRSCSGRLVQNSHKNNSKSRTVYLVAEISGIHFLVINQITWYSTLAESPCQICFMNFSLWIQFIINMLTSGEYNFTTHKCIYLQTINFLLRTFFFILVCNKATVAAAPGLCQRAAASYIWQLFKSKWKVSFDFH